MAIVRTPVKGLSGIWCNTLFRNGVGETDNPNALRYFREHGYTIEETGRRTVERTDSEPVSSVQKPDFESMSVEELRLWMKENGLGGMVRNIQNKEKLLEIIRSH